MLDSKVFMHGTCCLNQMVVLIVKISKYVGTINSTHQLFYWSAYQGGTFSHKLQVSVSYIFKKYDRDSSGNSSSVVKVMWGALL